MRIIRQDLVAIVVTGVVFSTGEFPRKNLLFSVENRPLSTPHDTIHHISYLCTNLVAALAGLYVNNFPHVDV